MPRSYVELPCCGKIPIVPFKGEIDETTQKIAAAAVSGGFVFETLTENRANNSLLTKTCFSSLNNFDLFEGQLSRKVVLSVTEEVADLSVRGSEGKVFAYNPITHDYTPVEDGWHITLRRNQQHPDFATLYKRLDPDTLIIVHVHPGRT